MLCISVSSVIRASHWFMADGRIRQSMKSLSIFLILKALCRIVVSCISIVFIVSAYARARMPQVILSGGIFPEAAYLAPFAESSKRVILLMKILWSFCISLMGALVGRFLTAIPTGCRERTQNLYIVTHL